MMWKLVDNRKRYFASYLFLQQFFIFHLNSFNSNVKFFLTLIAISLLHFFSFCFFFAKISVLWKWQCETFLQHCNFIIYEYVLISSFLSHQISIFLERILFFHMHKTSAISSIRCNILFSFSLINKNWNNFLQSFSSFSLSFSKK